MFSQSLLDLFKRDLPKVTVEIEAYSDDELIWKVAEGTNNSAGNLALHIAGNLQHFFGATLNNSNYVRDREFEFNGKVSRQKLLDELKAALMSVSETLDGMSDEQLQADYPIQPFGKAMTTEWFFTHLYAHLLYHLGQINYHRRILDL
jgi:uncharacterized damage-inducible protein DinB